MNKIIYLFILVSSFSWAQTIQPEDLTGMRAIGSPANPKVKIAWDKYHDYAQLKSIYTEMAKAYPSLVKVNSIGKSYQNRDIYILEITDYQSGNAAQKPGFYIDGGIHANELQATEISNKQSCVVLLCPYPC